jgi:uncharacterized protein (TIGR00255 family)
MGPLSVEVRSVNHRFCDISLKLPRKLGPLEGRIKELIKSRFSRGRIEMSVRLDFAGRNAYRLEPDVQVARQYVDALRTLKAKLRLKGDVSIDMVAQAKDVILPVEDEETAQVHWEEVREVIERSLDTLEEMRRREGEGLALDLRKRLCSMRDLLERIKSRGPGVLEDYRRRLAGRLEHILEGTDLDASRFNQEVAYFAERSDITEETLRMMSHMDQMEQTMAAEDPIGRKLEFLVQEIHREANTVSSKANDDVISQMVIQMKGDLEKIREQIQNIE